jgi:pimeloyl-ACP methyl ester carboxylesterase
LEKKSGKSTDKRRQNPPKGAADAAIAQALPRYDLERFHVPTLVFSVENDQYETYPGARHTAEHIDGARFIGYPTGGHLVVGHQPEVWSEVHKFLKTAG